MTKSCAQCGRDWPLSKYANIWGTPDGRGSVCEDCRANPGHCRSAMPLGSTRPVCPNDPLPGRRFCAEHAAQLDGARGDGNGWTAQTVVPTAPVKVTRAKPTVVKLPREQRARMLAEAVHAAGHLTMSEAVDAAGLSNARGSFKRVATYAVEQGWIKSRRGGRGDGYERGPVAGTAQPQAA